MPQTAARALSQAASLAEPLPMPAELGNLGLTVRRGNLMMIAGAPGTGKSQLAQWWASRITRPCLYFSADMTPVDAITRQVATMTGQTLAAIGKGMDGPAGAYYQDVLSDSNIQFVFDSNPSLEDLVEELDAYVEVEDAWPEVVVVDNLLNMYGAEEREGQMQILSELHNLARVISSLVIVLHHASEANQKDPAFPAAKRDIQNKVTHHPEIVVTVALDQVNELFRIAVVKFRSGRADASGKTFLELSADPARCSYSIRRDVAVQKSTDAVRKYWEEVSDE